MMGDDALQARTVLLASKAVLQLALPYYWLIGKITSALCLQASRHGWAELCKHNKGGDFSPSVPGSQQWRWRPVGYVKVNSSWIPCWKALFWSPGKLRWRGLNSSRKIGDRVPVKSWWVVFAFSFFPSVRRAGGTLSRSSLTSCYRNQTIIPIADRRQGCKVGCPPEPGQGVASGRCQDRTVAAWVGRFAFSAAHNWGSARLRQQSHWGWGEGY